MESVKDETLQRRMLLLVVVGDTSDGSFLKHSTKAALVRSSVRQEEDGTSAQDAEGHHEGRARGGHHQPHRLRQQLEEPRQTHEGSLEIHSKRHGRRTH